MRIKIKIGSEIEKVSPLQSLLIIIPNNEFSFQFIKIFFVLIQLVLHKLKLLLMFRYYLFLFQNEISLSYNLITQVDLFD